jgi:hypothetical protein
MELAIQIAAACGPVALAVMGVVVSLNPPNRTGRAHKVWAGSFALVGIVSACAIFFELRGTDTTLSQIWEHLQSVKPDTKQAGPNKYVCVTSLKRAENNYLLLVEFGVLDHPTNGQTVGALIGANYDDVKYWFAPPLRTDFQPFSGGVGLMMGASEKKLPNSLAMTISMPAISPKSSFYMLFSGTVPLLIAQQAFVEDHQITMASDPAEFNRLLAAPYANCPRSRD